MSRVELQKPFTRRRLFQLGAAGTIALLNQQKEVHAGLRHLPELASPLSGELKDRAVGSTTMFFRDIKDSPRQQQSDYLRDYVGSAFHVRGDGIIITNAHVVAASCLTEDQYRRTDLTSRAQLVTTGSFRPDFAGFSIGHPAIGTMPVHLVHISSQHDYAVLRYDTSKYTGQRGLAWLPTSSQLPTQGETLHHCAYQLNAVISAESFRINMMRAQYLGRRGSLEILAENVDKHTNFATATAGSSGSPILNSAGYVVGIQRGVWINNSENRYMINKLYSNFGFVTPSQNAATSESVPITSVIF